MLADICKRCKICSRFLTMTEMVEPNLYHTHFVSTALETETPRILVLDDAQNTKEKSQGVALVDELLNGNHGFTYSTTIRCSHNAKTELRENLETAASYCAVWTHSIEEERAVILTTKRGLSQLRIDKECREGDLFKSQKLGVILVIPNLSTISPGSSNFNTYQAKVNRALKEVGL